MAGQFRSKRKSFFAEQRESNSNPNFFNTMDFNLLRNNVKRIVKDASEGNILPEDYVYFGNDNVINACLQESWDNYIENHTLRLALECYRAIGLPSRWVTPDVDINMQYIVSGNALIKATERENIWYAVYNIFVSISQKVVDPQSALIALNRFQKQSIRSL